MKNIPKSLNIYNSKHCQNHSNYSEHKPASGLLTSTVQHSPPKCLFTLAAGNIVANCTKK